MNKSKSDNMMPLKEKRWAVEDAKGAIISAIKNKKKEIKSILVPMGECETNKTKIEKTIKEHLKLIDLIEKSKSNSEISLKLTNVGLCIDRELAYRNAKKIASHALKKKIDVWIDMEEIEYVASTLSIYRKLVGLGNVHIAIQAYLKRSLKDTKSLGKLKGKIRLIKGIYKKDKKGFYKTDKETTRNFIRIMEWLFKNTNSVVLGTHNKGLLKKALILKKKYKKNLEFQILMGRKLPVDVPPNVLINVYIPFGKRWKEYVERRENELKYLKH